MQFDGACDVLALDLLGHVLVVDPAIAVAGDLPAGGEHGLHRGGIGLHRLGHAEHGQRQAALGEDAMQAPETGAAAVFVQAFHRHRAHAAVALRADHLRQEGFRTAVAVQHAVLAAFLVVDDALHGDLRAMRPARVRRGGAIADQVARFAHASGSADVSRIHAASAASTPAPGGQAKPSPRSTVSSAPRVISTLCLAAL